MQISILFVDSCGGSGADQSWLPPPSRFQAVDQKEYSNECLTDILGLLMRHIRFTAICMFPTATNLKLKGITCEGDIYLGPVPENKLANLRRYKKHGSTRNPRATQPHCYGQLQGLQLQWKEPIILASGGHDAISKDASTGQFIELNSMIYILPTIS